MRYAHVLALVFALSFAVSSEGFRLKREGRRDDAVGFRRHTGEPSMAEEEDVGREEQQAQYVAGFVSAEEEGVGEEDLKEQEVDKEHEVEGGDEEHDEEVDETHDKEVDQEHDIQEAEEDPSLAEEEVEEQHEEDVDDEALSDQHLEESPSFVEQDMEDWFNASASAELGKCESWCRSDKPRQGHRHCAPGDMANKCGSCSYCKSNTRRRRSSTSGTCESWCPSDRSKQGHRHCAPGDMASSCGGCSYCKSSSPERRRRTTSTPRRRSSPGGGGGGKVTVVSYNLMSWCTQGICRGGRMKNIANGIKKYRPAVLGTQEHGDKNAPYDKVRKSLSPTGLTHRGSSTYYDPSQVTPVGSMRSKAVYKSYRHVSGQIYKIKGCSGSNCEFAYYNTHWDHGHGNEQAGKVIDFMKSHSKGRPMVLTGDFNVWGGKGSIDRIKNKLNMKEVSASGSTWCAGGKVDFILASRSGWSASGAVTDSNNCDVTKKRGRDTCPSHTCSSKASDHKLLKVDLKRV